MADQPNNIKIPSVPPVDELIPNAGEEYDLVLTADTALADAINSRIRGPQIGLFACTPRGYVFRRSTGELFDRRGLFLSAAGDLDAGWKELRHTLDHVLDCWQATGSLREITSYDRFRNDLFDRLVNYLEETPSIFRAMQHTRVPPEPDVAVLGKYQLNGLDRSVLPEHYDSYPLLSTDEEIELPPFRLFDTPTHIVEALLRNLDADRARDIGVVLDPDSPYEPLLKSALLKEDIPFTDRYEAKDHDGIRLFLSLVEAAGARKRLTVRDLRPLLNHLEEPVSRKYDRMYARFVDAEPVNQVLELLETARSETMGDLLRTVEEKIGMDLSFHRELLAELGLADELPEPEKVQNLRYFLDGFSSPIRESKQGVLLAAPGSSTFVDRTIVFYLGMDTSWSRPTSPAPWRDASREREHRLRDFQVLVQNGKRQMYLVEEKQANRDITPCLSFHKLAPEGMELTSFADLRHTRHVPPDRSGPVHPFEHRETDVTPSTVETLSQSRLNRLVKSPRHDQFSRLVDEPITYYRKRGLLYHQFAEFYLNHPDAVNRSDPNTCVDLMAGALKPFVDPGKMEQERTELHVGLRSIMDFVDRMEQEQREESVEGYGPVPRERENLFSTHFERSLTDPRAEAWFRNRDLRAHGVVDWVCSATELVDFKSGRAGVSGAKLAERALPDSVTAKSDFQVAMYLAHHRTVVPDRPLTFRFYHLLENRYDYLYGSPDPSDNIVDVEFTPEPLEDLVLATSFYEELMDYSESNDRVKTLDPMGYENYRQFFENRPLPEIDDEDRLLDSAYADEFIDYAKEFAGDCRYVEKGCRKILKDILTLKKGRLLAPDLDRFEEFLAEQVDRINRYKREGFPLHGVAEGVDLTELEHFDLLLRRDGVS